MFQHAYLRVTVALPGTVRLARWPGTIPFILAGMAVPSSTSFTTPRPVAWSPEREQRGASPARGPRCPVPACPVRYASGEDRPCRDHKREDATDQADARAWSLASVRTDFNHRFPQVVSSGQSKCSARE